MLNISLYSPYMASALLRPINLTSLICLQSFASYHLHCSFFGPNHLHHSLDNCNGLLLISHFYIYIFCSPVSTLQPEGSFGNTDMIVSLPFFLKQFNAFMLFLGIKNKVLILAYKVL